MSSVVAGRRTHRNRGELIVFHIGMTINQPWRLHRWIPVFLAMPKMLRELSADADSGLLGWHLLFGRRGPYVVQYWSSVEKLYAYASDQNSSHRPAWRAFNKRARSAPKAVGIWHETYVVDRAESIYVGTPRMGLPAATESIEVRPRHDRAKSRLEQADGSEDLS